VLILGFFSGVKSASHIVDSSERRMWIGGSLLILHRCIGPLQIHPHAFSLDRSSSTRRGVSAVFHDD
jgi:hypothetical protein